MTLIMSITNFAIFIAILFGYEFYLKKRRTRADVYFLASEESWYKILMLILGGSVFVVDVISKQASFFVYAVLFLSYTFTFKEIGESGVVNNLRRIPLKEISQITVEEKSHSFNVYYVTKNRTFEMIVRKSLAANLHDAVEKTSKLLKSK